MISTVVRRGTREEADSLQTLEQEGRHQRSLQEVFARSSVRVRHQVARRHVDAPVVALAGLLCVPLLRRLGNFLVSSRLLEFPPSDSSSG